MPPRYSMVLDASAVLAFARHSRAVGETLAEVSEEGQCFCVPSLCLAQAAARDANRDLIAVLVNRDNCVVPEDEWTDLANAMRAIGSDTDASNASITWHALAEMAYILTSDPDHYLTVHPALQTISIEEPSEDED